MTNKLIKEKIKEFREKFGKTGISSYKFSDVESFLSQALEEAEKRGIRKGLGEAIQRLAYKNPEDKLEDIEKSLAELAEKK